VLASIDYLALSDKHYLILSGLFKNWDKSVAAALECDQSFAIAISDTKNLLLLPLSGKKFQYISYFIYALIVPAYHH
jgi:hypothetical protein